MVLLDIDYYGSKAVVAQENGDIVIYMLSEAADVQNVLATYSNVHVKPSSVHWGHPRFNPFLLSTGLDGVINLYPCDVHSGMWGDVEKLAVLQDGIVDAKFSPEKFGLNIVCITFQDLFLFEYDEVRQLWIKYTHEKVSKLGNTCFAWDIALSRVAVAGNGGSVQVISIDFVTKAIERETELPTGDFTFQNVFWNGSCILLQSTCGRLFCWEEKEIEGTESNKSWRQREIPGEYKSTDRLLSFDPLGKVVIVSEDKSVKQLRIGAEKVYIISA